MLLEDQYLEWIDGTVGIASDFILHGKNNRTHDVGLHWVMEVSKQHGLVFNTEKCEINVS